MLRIQRPTPTAALAWLDSLIENMRNAPFPPGWMSNFVPEGALYHCGLALWEMPAEAWAGGYNNELRILLRNTSAKQFRNYALGPGFRQRPPSGVLSNKDLEELYKALFLEPYSKLDLKEFPSIYSQGTSISLQNVVFAPFKAKAPLPYTFYAYPELDSILREAARHQLSIFLNIGLSNNQGFLSNDLHYNLDHPQIGRTISPLLNIAFAKAVITDPYTYVIDSPTRPVWRDLLAKPHKNKMYPIAVLDVSHPEVLKLAIESIKAMVRRYGTVASFMVGGEAFMNAPDPKFATCPQKLTKGNCARCVPLTNYAAHTIKAFRKYMKLRFETPEAVNARWKLLPADRLPPRDDEFSAIDPRNTHTCDLLSKKMYPKAVEDFIAFSAHIMEEITILQYKTAKETMPGGHFSILMGGVEHSWLNSDGAMTNATTISEPWVANISRTSGRPAEFPITDPVIHFGCTEKWFKPPALFKPACMSKEHIDMFFSSLLTAGVVNIGYIKCATFGVWGGTSMQPLLKTLSHFKEIQYSHLRFMTPYQRVVVHQDRFVSSIPRFSHRLIEFLNDKQYPHALVSDMRVLERLWSRESIRRSVALVPFHEGLSELTFAKGFFDRYMKIFTKRPGSGAAHVFVDHSTASQFLWNKWWPKAKKVRERSNVVKYRLHPLNNCFVHVVLNEKSAHTAIFPLLQLDLDSDADGPSRVVVVATSPHEPRVHSNFVTDGLNYFVAITNRSPKSIAPVTVTVSINPVVQKRAGIGKYTFDQSPTFRLRPGETKFLFVRATIPGFTGTRTELLDRKAFEYQRNLQSLGKRGFQVGYGNRLAQSLLGATERELAPERYLAGLIILRNMIFMKTTRKGRKIDVELVDLLGNPVAGAMTQLIHVLNGHEAQEGKATDGQGKTTFFVEAVTEVRWDFFQGRYAVPELDPKTEPVEIHAHDAATGSQCFVTV